jgi:DNA-binding PadR family transcriptional regulator
MKGSHLMQKPRPAGYNLPKLVNLAVLLLLSRAGAEGIHGYQIKKLLSELPLTKRRPPDISGVYRALQRLETQGFLVSEAGEKVAGPERRLFKITPAGLVHLQEWVEALEEWHYEIHRLVLEARAAGIVNTVLD